MEEEEEEEEWRGAPVYEEGGGDGAEHPGQGGGDRHHLATGCPSVPPLLYVHLSVLEIETGQKQSAI